MKHTPIDSSCTTNFLLEWHDYCGQSMSFVNAASFGKHWAKGELTILNRVFYCLELWFTNLCFNRWWFPINGSDWWYPPWLLTKHSCATHLTLKFQKGICKALLKVQCIISGIVSFIHALLIIRFSKLIHVEMPCCSFQLCPHHSNLVSIFRSHRELKIHMRLRELICENLSLHNFFYEGCLHIYDMSFILCLMIQIMML